MNKKIGVIGDLHLKEKLGYADYIEDGRKQEENDVFDFMVDSFKDCDEIVFLGDNFNSKNNTSEVIKRFVVLLERFNEKTLYILAGNHEKHADGRTALDFLKEVNKPNWHIITKEVEVVPNSGLTFLPYLTKPEVEAKDDAEGIKKVMKLLQGGKILFLHYAISDSMAGVVSTNIFNEIVLPKTTLEKKFQLIMGGHIHLPQKVSDQTFVSGSVFTNEVGEVEKYIYKIDKETLEVESLKLPVRSIFKLENPTIDALKKLPANSIVKVVITDKKLEDEIPKIKSTLKRFDAFLFLEQYPNERKKIHFEEGMLDLKIENLLKVYSEEKKVSLNELNKAWKLIK